MALKNKIQPLCSLSSSESECIAISELMKAFAKQTIWNFGFNVEVPLPIHCDDQGTIDAVRNNVSGGGTRHVKTRFHFLRNCIIEVISCAHRESGENEGNIMTENLISAEFEKCSPNMHSEVPKGLSEEMKKRSAKR